MLTSLTHFTLYLVLSSSVLGAAIPAIAVTTASTAAATSAYSVNPRDKEATGALWKNNIHDKVYSSEAPAVVPTTEALRRSGELRKEGEHEEITLTGRAPSRRSGELWRGLGHDEIPTSPVF
ncbi:hypothetical protein BDR04DRAFT_1141476 [Suillus decipiens]|nr:hypothetical protein BDR04DRAFT_1141476 [Suillus decipiens]